MKIDDKEMLDVFMDVEKLKACQKYMQTIKNYDIENNLVNDLTYIFESIEQIASMMPNPETTDLSTLHNDIDTEYWTFKYLANIVNFINTMKPIARHFNPTDEDKAKFVEFIKKMEKQDDQ